MIRPILFRLLAGVVAVTGTLAASLIAPSAHAQTAYSIVGGTTLVNFNVATPGIFNTVGNFSGAVTSVDGIDFRPLNGLLYGYNRAQNQLVTINLATAATTAVSTLSTQANSVNLGLDFNPFADRLRLVTSPGAAAADQTDQNLRINVDTGATTVDTPLAYAAGDRNAGINPGVIESAYTNNFAGTGSTTLYYVDAVTDSLLTTTNPNGGVLSTVGSLGIDIDNLTGFDIFTSATGVNTAYGKFRVNGVNGLYSVDLVSGQATLVGNMATPAGNPQIFGLAVQPLAAPEPGTWALLATGALPLAGLVARRRRAR